MAAVHLTIIAFQPAAQRERSFHGVSVAELSEPVQIRPMLLGPSDQLSCLPFASPENVLLHAQQLVAILTRLGGDMDERQCLVLLAELSLVATRVATIEREIPQRVTTQAKRLGLL